MGDSRYIVKRSAQAVYRIFPGYIRILMIINRETIGNYINGGMRSETLHYCPWSTIYDVIFRYMKMNSLHEIYQIYLRVLTFKMFVSTCT